MKRESILFHTVYLGIILFAVSGCQKPTSNPQLQVVKDPTSGQVVVSEGERVVLQYNYQTIYQEDVIHLEGAKPENYIKRESDTFKTASRYAVPRSNYIHPIYGLGEEMLTRDWPDGVHPHHRGVFWAWPEVYLGSKLGDIYALQTVFARPTGNIKLIPGDDYAVIVAENEWRWEDTEAIVRETAAIKVLKAEKDRRIIDLSLRFTALKDSITIATRKTDSYGGLNLRMQTPDDQSISYHTDDEGAITRMAWSDFTGLFEGRQDKSGLAVFQHAGNREYPGAWVEYPDLAWVQPTFPTPGTRYALERGKPLDLHYRLIIHEGGEQDAETYRAWWNEYQRDEFSTKLLEGID